MESIPPAPVIPLQSAPRSIAPLAPPRSLAPLARRRAWLEPRVRRWWLLAILIVILFAAYAGDRLFARADETKLIRFGIALPAKIVAAENKMDNQLIGPADNVRLELDFPDQTTEAVTGHISSITTVGSLLSVHVDPADHSHWTDRAQPTPLLDSLLIGLLVLPIMPVMLLVAWLQAKGLLKTWESGSSAVAVIFDRRQSPIAPLSYAVRCSLHNSRQKQLFTVYVPRVGYGLEKGDLIWVIVPPKKGRPLAALWMAGEKG